MIPLVPASASVWQLPLLSRLYPDAHYVHVIRDGRDVAMSLTLTRGETGDLEATDRSASVPTAA